MRKFHSYFILIFFVSTFVACTYDALEMVEPEKVQLNADGTIGFQLNILPIIQTKCSAESRCHAGPNDPPNQPKLTNYAEVKAIVDNGEMDDEVFVTKDMPKEKGTYGLTAQEEKLLRDWVAQGAPQ